MKKKILITGATGTIGRSLIKQLQAIPADFIAGTRDFSKAQSILNISKNEWVEFDFMDVGSFENATKQVDRVFVLGPPLTFHLEQILIPFIDHLKNKEINSVVYLSAFGSESLGGKLAFHSLMERYIKEKGFDYTILQPSFFSQNFKNFEYENLIQRGITFNVAGEGKVGFVDTEDVAKVAAKVLTEEGHTGKTYQLTGPGLLSYNEAALILSEVLGKRIVYPNPSEEDYRAVLQAGGAPDFIAEYMIPVFGMIKNGNVGRVTEDIELILGKKPTDLKTVLLRDFASEKLEKESR